MTPQNATSKRLFAIQQYGAGYCGAVVGERMERWLLLLVARTEMETGHVDCGRSRRTRWCLRACNSAW